MIKSFPFRLPLVQHQRNMKAKGDFKNALKPTRTYNFILDL